MTETGTAEMESAPGSPGGVPRPSGDLHEHPEGPTAATVADEELGDVEEEGQEEPQGGIPLAQVLVGGTCLLGLGGGLVYQAWGLTGLAAGAAVPTAGVAAYVRHRRDRRAAGRSGASSSWWGGEARRTGRSGAASLLPGLGGGRSGRSGAGRKGGGRTGGGSGSSTGGRSGKGAGFRMPGLPTVMGSAGGRGFGAGRGRSAAGGGGRRGGAATGSGAGGAKGTAGKGATAGSRTPGAGAKRSTGGGSAAGSGRGRAGERVRKAVRDADARTGHRVSRAATAAGRWVDDRTGGRAATAAKATRRRWRKARKGLAAVRRHRRTAQVSLGLGLLAAVLAGPWALVVAALGALAGALAWWRWRRRAETGAEEAAEATTEAGGADDEPIETPKPAGDAGGPGPDHTGAGPRVEEAAAFAAAGGGRRPRPHTTNPRSYRERRSTIVGGFPLTVAAAEMSATAAAYAPQDMWAVDKELEQLPELPGYVALALRTYVQRLNAEYPIHPAVLEKFYELCQGQAALVQAAQEITGLFKQAHEHDIARDEARRTNEHLWNV